MCIRDRYMGKRKIKRKMSVAVVPSTSVTSNFGRQSNTGLAPSCAVVGKGVQMFAAVREIGGLQDIYSDKMTTLERKMAFANTELQKFQLDKATDLKARLQTLEPSLHPLQGLPQSSFNGAIAARAFLSSCGAETGTSLASLLLSRAPLPTLASTECTPASSIHSKFSSITVAIEL
eukprot:TRINITY_DN2088_c0_g3_i7.p1 TRINITY_DN2088_c0_g3~~TRINITY_DN2088_c0_g3_i7.p1  ORF type:complete len:176 (-),score=33.04 TRINITY_DN2088_c0_g3_i7:514-1041(-)